MHCNVLQKNNYFGNNLRKAQNSNGLSSPSAYMHGSFVLFSSQRTLRVFRELSEDQDLVVLYRTLRRSSRTTPHRYALGRGSFVLAIGLPSIRRSETVVMKILRPQMLHRHALPGDEPRGP